MAPGRPLSTRVFSILAFPPALACIPRVSVKSKQTVTVKGVQSVGPAPGQGAAPFCQPLGSEQFPLLTGLWSLRTGGQYLVLLALEGRVFPCSLICVFAGSR